MENLIFEQLEYRKDPNKNSQLEHAILLLKPGYSDEHIQEVVDFVSLNKLKIVLKDEILFSNDAIVARKLSQYLIKPSGC